MLGLCQECRLSVHFRRNPYVKASLISKILIAAYGLIVRQRIVYRKLCLSSRPLRLHRVWHTHIPHLVRNVILSGRVQVLDL